MTIHSTPPRSTLVLGVLFAGAFVMGCAEMLVVGLLDLIAADLTVSVPAAGALVTANAIGLAVGGPVLTFIVTRFDRRTVLLATLGVFLLANLLPAMGAGYTAFLIARVVIGSVQGLFIAAAMVTATAIVPPARSGRAMSLVIAGFATSSALGLPLGTLLGQAVGWRGSFVAVVAAGVVVGALAALLLPRVPTSHESHATGQARHALAPRVLAILAVSLLLFAGMLSVVTYLVPLLNDVTGIAGPGVSVYLLLYGVATAVGSFAGGRFADDNAARALTLGAGGVLVSLVAVHLFAGNAWLVALAILGVGLFGMGAAPSIQHRVVSLAGPGAPLAAALPASAVNAGIAFGALAGGAALDGGGIAAVTITGVVIAVIALAAAAATSRLAPRPVAAAVAMDAGTPR
jgi:DHA1 family inner membrane transport protein